MRRVKKSKAAASKPVRTQSNVAKSLGESKNVVSLRCVFSCKHREASFRPDLFQDETRSAATTSVRRSERIRVSKPHITRKKQGLGTAVPPRPTIEKEAGRCRSAIRSTETNQGRIEELEPTGPTPPESDKRNEQKDSEKKPPVAQDIKTESKSALKPKARERRSKKAKPNREPPIETDKHNTRVETVQLGQGAAVKRRGKSPLQSPQNLPEPSDGSKNFTQELLEDDIPIPESSPENWDYIYSESQTYHSHNQNVEDENDSYVDPQEAFNRKWGYLPPLDDEATRVINFIIANPAMAASQSRVQAGTPAFGKGLGDRNVKLIPSNTLDYCKKQIQLLDVQNFMNEPKDEEIGHEVLWKLDQAKITATSSEAIFQRTIMVSLVARHFLIYQRNSREKQMFEFSVEEPWTCFPMPSRALNAIERVSTLDDNYVAPQSKFLTQPKPDVAVAFNRRAIISDDIWETLTWPLKTLASFEKVDENNFNVFHFLGIEAKNSEKSVDDRKALHQCSNCASQALFNFYEFFHDAGPEHEKAFFDQVRFFSIVTNRTGFLVRIHRAVEIPKESRARRVIPQDSNYRLEFEFQELARFEGIDQFSRSNALNMIKKLLKYAEETMFPLIQSATSAICTKLNDPNPSFLVSRSHDNVYRHGQPGIAIGKQSQRPTPIASEDNSVTGQLARGVRYVPLSTQRALSAADEPMRSRQTTPRQPSHTPKTPSNLKRNTDDFDETKFTVCSQHKDTRVPKRRRAEAVVD